jgi:aspartate/methionine/tyrosine aminotransferase
MEKLTDNEYGFDVSKDNPFQIFRILQHYATESVGVERVIDLSRGDPGYGFTPSRAGREFLSFLVMIDSCLNNKDSRYIHDCKNLSYNEVIKIITEITKTIYSQDVADALIDQLHNFVDKIADITGRENKDVLFQMFKSSTVSGGTYHQPKGEDMVREVIAATLSKRLKSQIKPHEINFTNGANHAIGAVFEALGEEGLGYLKEGDTVAIGSPVYAPYNHVLTTRGFNIKSFNIDYLTGEVDEESLKAIEESEDRVKLILVIDPNNPTGFGATSAQLKGITGIARKHDSLIVSDEVYFRFFPEDKESIVDYAPERTMRIDALTKIERSAGLRFGFYTISDEANDYITQNILNDFLKEGEDFREKMHFAKSPGGGVEGYFQHVTFVPALCQYMGLAHTLLAEKEQLEYVEEVSGNMKTFVETLDLKHDGNMYYIIFNLGHPEISIEQKLVEIAKKGVVFIPAFRFFSESQRAQREADFLHTVRASVVNTSYENVSMAAKITKEYLNQI